MINLNAIRIRNLGQAGQAGQAVNRILGSEGPLDPQDLFSPLRLDAPNDGCFPVGTSQMCGGF